MNLWLTPFVKKILIALLVFLFFMLIFYIITIIVHWNSEKIKNKKRTEYNFLLNKIFQKQINPNSITIPKKNEKYVRDLLILKLKFSSNDEKKIIKKLYKIWGLEEEDIKQLKNQRWWKKVEALNRLEKMKISEAENEVIKLIENKRIEVRYAALKMLVGINSEKIYPVVYLMFTSSSRWAYRYLVNVLSDTIIPPAYLKPLAMSKDRDFRKAAAILLGVKENESALPLLEILSNDPIKDVRRETVRSLGEINTDKSLAIMQKHIEDPNYQIRASLAKGLSGYKNDTALKLLDKLANDDVFEVRLEAFYSLNKLGKRGMSIIEKYYKKYPNLAMEFLNKRESESRFM
ncbi:MAG: putative lyase [Candidatus Methanofastidiosum methylothiophilum]|uniref:Putative lyase n=1 Tax=Candidatus Methanofastidiosum methylothiophilum TaxID=1705564 RepID=A0A150J3W2_9EURY|nr:MAG: putative lyase [Candidatus Methanofastidiosum methylthiophilus]